MEFDTIILGAGAAGLMCAAHCGGRVMLVDHAKRAGEKIRISGGGRCNFTNTGTGPGNFLSQNPHFAKSALARYGPWDFVSLVSEHGIAWHEKTLGQLFCDDSAKQIVAMLTGLCEAAGVTLALETSVGAVRHEADGYTISLSERGTTRQVTAKRLVVATGGKSIPKMGATGLAYDIARQFGLTVTEIRPGLVPFTFAEGRFAALSGLSLPSRVTAARAFDEALLFTHRGLSGPAVLQASSYWREGEAISVNLLPGGDPFATLRQARSEAGRRSMIRSLDALMPARLADFLGAEWGLSGNLADQSDKALGALCERLTGWQLTPSGSEGYRTAEVTLGGVDTDGLDSRTMEARAQPGLHFIGECVDVTGWLGGYNFQWAWASAMACAESLRAG